MSFVCLPYVSQPRTRSATATARGARALPLSLLSLSLFIERTRDTRSGRQGSSVLFPSVGSAPGVKPRPVLMVAGRGGDGRRGGQPNEAKARLPATPHHSLFFPFISFPFPKRCCTAASHLHLLAAGASPLASCRLAVAVGGGPGGLSVPPISRQSETSESPSCRWRWSGGPSAMAIETVCTGTHTHPPPRRLLSMRRSPAH